MESERAPEPRLAWAWVARPAAGPLPRGFEARFLVGPDGLRPDPAGVLFSVAPVSAFSGLAPRERPAAFCPACLERVTLKLGRITRAHFAHRPHAVCAAARGEGARHLAAKLHLAAELSANPGAALRFRRVCAGPDLAEGGCALHAAAEPWPVRWDEVAVEQEMGGARPDVLLRLGGRVAGALEVRASHPVGAARAERYRGLGVPWLEVSARALLPDAGGPWRPGEPLDAVADAGSHPDRWRCPVCAPRHAAAEAMARDGVRLLAARPVHLYLRDAGRSGGEVRVRSFTVRAVEARRAGATVEVWLERSDTRTRLAGPEPAGDAAQALAAAHGLFRGWAEEVRRRRGGAVESPTGWAPAPSPAGPQRLRWDARAERFRGPPNLPALAWPPQAGLGEGWRAPHAVLGYARCAWSERTARGGVVTHAIAGAAWITLEVQAWAEAGEPMTRADVRAWRHDGSRWCAAAEASHAGPARDWAAEVLRLAEAAAAAPTLDAAVLSGWLAARAAPDRSAPPSPRSG